MSYAPQTWNNGAPPPINAARLTVIENGIRDAYETLGDGPPTAGSHVVSDRVWNDAPDAGLYAGWVCVVTGSPGTWLPFGLIAGTLLTDIDGGQAGSTYLESIDGGVASTTYTSFVDGGAASG